MTCETFWFHSVEVQSAVTRLGGQKIDGSLSLAFQAARAVNDASHMRSISSRGSFNASSRSVANQVGFLERLCFERRRQDVMKPNRSMSCSSVSAEVLERSSNMEHNSNTDASRTKSGSIEPITAFAVAHARLTSGGDAERVAAIGFIAGFMSTPYDGIPSRAHTAVVVPDPFQGSKIAPSLPIVLRTDSTNSSEKPA